ncbi:MAG: sugar phosphate isomerase/epimerase [Roseibium sp.]|nr:sugar phosphate isomerase/epimerase [Roseibium sp.]
MQQFSFQLYSARNMPSLNDALSVIAGAGYTMVEGYPDLYADPEATRAALDAAGLSMPSGHFSIDMLESDLERAMLVARVLGMSHLYCPFIAEQDRPKAAEGWIAFAGRLEKLAREFSGTGITFGWHNHDFEFASLEDGRVPMALLLEHAPTMSWEADIAWIVRGGQNPFDWISQYGDQISAVHVKDIAPAGECLDEDGWADVGHGTVDWAGLMAALSAGPDRLFVLEHDNPSDVKRFAERSFASVRTY